MATNNEILKSNVNKFASFSRENQKKLKKKKPQLVSEALMMSYDGVPTTGDKFRVFTKKGEKDVYFGYILNGSYFFFDVKSRVNRFSGGVCYTKFVKADN